MQSLLGVPKRPSSPSRIYSCPPWSDEHLAARCDIKFEAQRGLAVRVRLIALDGGGGYAVVLSALPPVSLRHQTTESVRRREGAFWTKPTHY
jgi:hypothetical protein